MNASVEVRSVFMLKGRGAVAIGYLRQGAVRVGQQTQPLALGTGPLQVLTLAAVEIVHAVEGGKDALGLVFRERPSLDALRTALAAGMMLHCSDAAVDGDV